MPKRGELAQLFGAAEGNNLERHGKIDLGLGQQSSEYSSHLFEL
jgi:hypothetical protein